MPLPSRRLLFLAGLLFFFCPIISSYSEERVSDYLVLPPAMKRQLGDPLVKVEQANHKWPAFALSSIRVELENPTNREAVRLQLATQLARSFYQKNFSENARSILERRMNMHELIPMDAATFENIARKRLRGVDTGNSLHDSWWNVRMGEPLQLSQSHHLVLITLQVGGDQLRENTGHFAFGVRKKGGNSDRDIVFDFRAPWPYDRSPRFTEAPNIHNRLKLGGMTENMYDWLYTHTEYRNCYANLWFFPVAKEQLDLLFAFDQKRERHNAGNFRVWKKNCASLGALFYDRIHPVDDELPGKMDPIDFPRHMANRVVKRYPESDTHYLRIWDYTEERGRQPTAKSKIHRAQPSRPGSRPYQLLLKDPLIN